ncbi:MAG: carboxypeptidase M32, partial [Pseudomonadota bacterium]
MTTLPAAYDELVSRGEEIAYLNSVTSLLHWDRRTGLPERGHMHRAGQIAALTKIRHAKTTDPRWKELLSIVEGSELTKDPETVTAVNIREWKRTYERTENVPQDLATAIAKASSEAESAWEQARPRDDWDLFKPGLITLVNLKREWADAVGYETEPYDAFLEDYEQGMTAHLVETLFSTLRKSAVALLDRIKGSSVRPMRGLGGMSFPIVDQERLARRIAVDMGFDMSSGRLDVSAHPFTTGIGPGDVRITTRYSEDDPTSALFGTVHETGHALYHQGLPLEYWGRPFCRPASLGVNESQSRMWENMVARSASFWRAYYPMAGETFPGLKDVSLNDFLLSINEVKPSLIRVEADEVTYDLHIMLRFELELDLMRGVIQVDDLPDAWNEKTKSYLGLDVPDRRSGVMQDVHWSLGAFGYFPTYTLGNVYAAQFFDKARKDIGDLDAMFEKGEFRPLLGWLRDRIHSQGS